jgi:hypothetical protein
MGTEQQHRTEKPEVTDEHNDNATEIPQEAPGVTLRAQAHLIVPRVDRRDTA